MKRFFVLLLAVLMVMSVSVVAFAGAVPMPRRTDAERIQDIKNDPGYTQTQKDAMIDKILNPPGAALRTLKAAQAAQRRLPAYNIFLDGNTFTYYQSAIKSYCLPACTKMILQYINGTSPSQTTLAADMQYHPTYWIPFGAIVYRVLNSYQSANMYILQDNGPGYATQIDMENDFMWGIDADCPSVYCATFTKNTNGGYPYPMDAYHALVPTGYRSDYSRYQSADPYAPYVPGGCAQQYWVNTDIMYEAVYSYIY